MFINPKSFFTSWAVQFSWLLAGPPREEIFPAALCRRAPAADWKPRGDQRSPCPSPRSSLPRPCSRCRAKGTVHSAWLGTAATPLPAPSAEGVRQCPADSCTHSVEHFPNKGREGEGLAWPTAGCQLTKLAHLQRFCFGAFCRQPKPL